jgi:ABC-type lipoprotein release transport system permease subunit
MTGMLVRLAFAGIRSRLLASGLTIAIAAAAVATIVLALEVRASGIDPWQRTFDEANGAHVLAFVPSDADAAAIGELPGVTERDAPVPLVLARGGSRESTDLVQLAGQSRRPEVNTPLRTAGSRLRDGGIVLERSLARALGLEVGDTFEVTSRSGDRSIEVPVLGTAVVPSQARYPRSKPGLAWVTPATLERVEPDRSAWRWSEAVRLADPSASSAFAARAAATLPAASRSGSLSFQTWQAQRDNALGDAQGTQVIVTMFTILLLIVAFIVVGILVGARAGEQHRQIGLLKAVGFTPRQVGIVFALESVALGVVAAAVGFALGAILAPRLAEPSAQTLVGSPTTAANPWHIVVACCVVLPVLFAGAVTSTRRSTRFTTLEAIRAGTSTPPDSRLARAVGRSALPLTTALGLKDLLGRGRRALLLAAAIAVTGAVVVTALSLDATLDAQRAAGPSDFPDELLALVYTLDIVLLLITATTLTAVALLSVRERVRDYGVLKAVGLTPGQIVSIVVSSNAVLAVLASIVAMPLGIGLYLALAKIASGTTADIVIAPWWSLALIPVGTAVVVLAATSLPAWLATRLQPADALRYE